jgi:uncharacterized protein with PIN domain
VLLLLELLLRLAGKDTTYLKVQPERKAMLPCHLEEAVLLNRIINLISSSYLLKSTLSFKKSLKKSRKVGEALKGMSLCLPQQQLLLIERTSQNKEK